MTWGDQGEIERSGLLPPCTSSVPKARFILKTVIPPIFFYTWGSKGVRLLKGDKFVSSTQRRGRCSVN